jgi:hypothetical protein
MDDDLYYAVWIVGRVILAWAIIIGIAIILTAW